MLTLGTKDLSTYRTPLMGMATLMIIACHAPASGVVLPQVLSRLLTMGNYGVDLFLLLSGIGVYYSLSKQSATSLGGVLWYKKRLNRIIIPYLIVYIPYSIVMLLQGKYTMGECLLCLSTLEYWVSHRGAWFVSLILVLYLLSPQLFIMMKSKGRWLYEGLIIVGIMAICNSVEPSGSGFVSNVVFALGRVPSFLLGMGLGNLCQQNRKISASWIIMPVVLYVVFVKVCAVYHALAWMLIPLMTYLFILFLKLTKAITCCVRAFNFLGKISLESYLTNITLNSLLQTLIPAYVASSLFYGRWIEYTIVVVVGLIVAYYVNKISSQIQNRVAS